MLNKVQANEILEAIWHLPCYHEDRLYGTAWLLHQIISWKLDLDLWLHPSPVPEPYYDDFFIVGSAILNIPVNILNSETALYLMRHCALAGHIASGESLIEGRARRTLRDCTGWPKQPHLLQAVTKLYLDTDYLSWIEKSKLDPVEAIWRAGYLPVIK